MPEIYTHIAYGLGIHSTLPLPEFCAAKAGCDVLVRLENPSDGKMFSWPTDDQWHVKISPTEATLAHRQVAVFHLREGREITIAPAPEADHRLLQLYVAGTVMALLLSQRGFLVLHASVVAIDGKAVAFLGDSGMGKSSLAAALFARGHRFVSDDAAVISQNRRESLVYPGFPQLKLSLEAGSSLGYGEDMLSPLHTLEEKRGLHCAEHFAIEPIPLGNLYVFAEESRCVIQRVQPSQAMIDILRHSYPTRLKQAGDQRHFLQCAHLVKSHPVYSLTRLRSLTRLPDLARLVEGHSRGETTGQ